MSDVIAIANKVSNVDVSPAFDAYSRVIIHISDDEQVVVGDESGRTLEFDNPFGNTEMATRILASLRGFRYRPYSADGALLDPAAEIGDAAETTTSYGGIYTRSRQFGRLMKANISAPHDEEIDHEYTFESPTERKFKREVGEVRASLTITNTRIQSEVTELRAADAQLSEDISGLGDDISAVDVRLTSRITQTATQISSEVSAERTRAKNAESGLSDEIEVQASRITQTANAITAEVQRAKDAEAALSITADNISASVSNKVSANGGSASTFGWKMDSTSHTWTANNKEVMKITASGLVVSGEVNADSGKIGGFTIGNNAIYNNISEFGGTQSKGVYVGTDGIQVGQDFKVDRWGQVTATSLKLKGVITFLDDDGNSLGTLGVDQLRTGALQSYYNHDDWSSAYASTAPGGYCYGGAGGGYIFNNARSSGSPVDSFFGQTIGAFSSLNVYNSGSLRCYGSFYKGNTLLSLKTKTINGTTINYLGY